MAVSLSQSRRILSGGIVIIGKSGDYPQLLPDGISLLIEQPPELIASEIKTWIHGQFRGPGDRASISGYIFHAMKKLDEMARLHLVSQSSLVEYLRTLESLVMEFCPDEERESLYRDLQALGRQQISSAGPVTFIHRPAEDSATSVAGCSGEGLTSEGVGRSRRFSLLLDRLLRESFRYSGAAEGQPDEDLARVLSAAAADAKTSSEMQELRRSLASIGLDLGTEDLFRRLGHSLPKWVVPVRFENGNETPDLPQNSVVQAMSQFMRLAESRKECEKRLQELVEAAIEQFNGSRRGRNASGNRRRVASPRRTPACRALVPDSCTLIPSQSQPTPGFENNANLTDELWLKVVAGTTPQECEAGLSIDAYTVRSALARWVEESALSIV